MPSIQDIRKQFPQYGDMSDAALKAALHAKYYSDMPLADFEHKIGGTGETDTRTGAPKNVRAAVGAMPDDSALRPNDSYRMKAMEKFYGKGNVQREGDNNFTFTDPKTGKRTLYNPPGMDMGDVASLQREAAEVFGGIGGAIAGGAAGTAAFPGPGTVLGAMGGAGAGATAMREGVERTAMGTLGIADERSLSGQALEALPTFALNAGGQGIGMASGVAGAAGVRGGVRGATGGRDGMQTAIDDMGRFGATPSLAAATQNAAIDSFEGFVASVPGGVGVVRNAARKTSETVAKGMDAKLTSLARGSSLDSIAAGQAVITGVEQFAKNFMDNATILYQRLDGFLPKDKAVTVANTQRILDELGKATPGAENFTGPMVSPKLAEMAAGLAKDAKNGALPYGAIKAARSDVGRRLGDPWLVSDIPRAELKRVYKALADDMRIAAQAQGPDALKAFDRANKFYLDGVNKIDDLLEPMVRNKIPEQAWAAVETAANQGPTRLRALRESVSPEQWRIIGGTVATRMGRAAPGQQGEEAAQFSFQRFLTNWQKLGGGDQKVAKEVKDILFGGKDMGGIHADLDALARASERIITSSKAFANPSGSGRNIVGGAMALGAAGSAVTGNPGFLLTVVGAMVVGNIGAKLVTSPRVVHWLAQSTRVNANGVPAHIGRLGAIALDSDASTRDAIFGLLTAIEADAERQDMAAQQQQPMQFTPPMGRAN